MKKLAFTLAEALVVLSAIGFLASLTMPSLVINQKNKEHILRAKKAQVTLKTAIDIINLMGEDLWQGTGDKHEQIRNSFEKYIKYRDKGDITDYVPPKYGKYTNRGVLSTSGWKEKALVTRDGMTIGFYSRNQSCNFRYEEDIRACGAIIVDTNGSKGPNEFGIDALRFYIVKDSNTLSYNIVPAGFTSKCKPYVHDCSYNILYKDLLTEI